MNQNPNGHPFETRWLKASEIKFDESYQRPVEIKRVLKAVKEFNGDVFNDPKISCREDGNMYCFDGRHSTAIWQTYHDNPDEQIRCKVFHGMTWEQEIEAFIQQAGFSKSVAEVMKIRAKKNRGDEDVVDMVNIIESLGWTISFDGAKNNSDCIVAVTSVYNAYKKLGSMVFREMMTTIREAWGSDTDAITSPIITGMREMYQFHWGEFKRCDLVSSLRQKAPIKIVRDGRANESTTNHKYGKEIWKTYNYKRRNKLEEKM